MMEENFISSWSSSWSQPVSGTKNDFITPLPLVTDLNVPLPDIPALSLPDDTQQFPSDTTSEESGREDEDIVYEPGKYQ